MSWSCPEKGKAWYEANRDHVAERGRAYRERNGAALAERKKAWYDANRDSIAAQKREYYRANRAAILEQKRAVRLRDGHGTERFYESGCRCEFCSSEQAERELMEMADVG